MMACEASNAHLPVWDYRHSLCLLGLHTEPHWGVKAGDMDICHLGCLIRCMGRTLTDALSVQIWFLTIIHCLNVQC